MEGITDHYPSCRPQGGDWQVTRVQSFGTSFCRLLAAPPSKREARKVENMLQPRNTSLLERAKDLRKNMTPQERKLWYLLLAKYPIRFQRQAVIKSFIADFYCAKALLIIELDGNQHYTEKGIAYDDDRTDVLKSLGIEVIRFHNEEVDMHFHEVCRRIEEILKERHDFMSKRRMVFQDNNGILESKF